MTSGSVGIGIITPAADREKDARVLLEPSEAGTAPNGLRMSYGFCLSLSEIESLALSPPMGIDEFTEAALVAEGYRFMKSDPLCQKASTRAAQALSEYLGNTPA